MYIWPTQLTHPAHVGSCIGAHQRIPDASDHLREPNKCLRELLVSKETIATKDGSLHIAGSNRVKGWSDWTKDIVQEIIKEKRPSCGGYYLGISSRMEAILKNQFRQVSLAESGTCSGVKFSKEKEEATNHPGDTSHTHILILTNTHPYTCLVMQRICHWG